MAKSPGDGTMINTEQRDTRSKDIEQDPVKTSADNEQKTKQEIGGPKGLEPTRYGDWEVKGRCSDF